MFFTKGLPFFWEDFEFFHLDNANPYTSVPQIIKSYIREFFAPGRFFHAGFETKFSDRPYQYLNNSLLGMLFGDNILFYKIIKSLIFALSAFLIFFVINRASTLFALLGAFFYITSPEVWAGLAYNSDNTLYAQFFTLLAVAVFFSLLERKYLNNMSLWLFYSLILVISQFSVLAKNDARYLAVLCFFTIFLFQRARIWLHLPMLIALLIFEIPVFGLVSKFFFGVSQPVINIASYNSRPFLDSLKTISQNYIFPLTAIGRLNLIVFLIILIVGALIMISHHFKRTKSSATGSLIVNEQVFFSFFWFIFALLMVAEAKNFKYEGLSDYSLVVCTFFIVPFIIFLCNCIPLVTHRAGKFNLPLKGICAALILTQIFIFNIPRLNQFRGGWGNYFCGFDNARKYIIKNSQSALVLAINNMKYEPFIIKNPAFEVRSNMLQPAQNPFADLDFIRLNLSQGRFKDIYVLKRGEVEFRGAMKDMALKEKLVLDGDSGDLYDRMKRFIARPSRPSIYMYRFTASN